MLLSNSTERRMELLMNIGGVEGNLVDSKDDHVWGLPLCLLWYFTTASAGVYPPSKVLVIDEGYVLTFICVHSGYRTIGEYGKLHWRWSAFFRGHVVHSSIRFLSLEVLWLLWNIDIWCRSCVTVVLSLLWSQSFSHVSDCILSSHISILVMNSC